MGNLGYFTPKDGVMGLLASGDVSLGVKQTPILASGVKD